jgi:hypothetical protein
MLRNFALALVCTLVAACTAGKVTRDGQDIAGATVTILTCDNTEYTTTTAADGTWAFNPTSPDSGDFDVTQNVPQGPIFIRVVDGGEEYAEFHHHYYATCPYTIDGVSGVYPCRLYPIDFVPMNLLQMEEVRIDALEACIQS